MNLSNQTLSTAETDLLDLGLSFIPNINRVDYSCIEKSLHKLIRSIKYRDHFGDDDDQAPQHIISNAKNFMHPSTWEPRYKDLGDDAQQLISKLQETTETILRKFPLKENSYLIKTQPNITREQRRAISKLRANDKIIVKSADKGGMVCVLDKAAYLTEAYRQLVNTKYYKSIQEPLQKHNIPAINCVLEDLYNQGYITKRQHEYLNASEADKLRHFYLLPKIHKPISKWTLPNIMPEGRPIVGDCGTESRRVSEYIDSFLKPLANKHPSYIKDTYDFINKIRNRRLYSEYILVTGDITALYTNMNIDRTLAIVKDMFDKHPDPHRPDNELLELLEIALKNNDF